MLATSIGVLASRHRRPSLRSLPLVRRSAAEKLQAWIVTGPLGHLWSALADMTLIWARYLAHRARRG